MRFASEIMVICRLATTFRLVACTLVVGWWLIGIKIFQKGHLLVLRQDWVYEVRNGKIRKG